MSQRPTIHQVSGGWCRVCGELEDWLRDQGEVVEMVDALQAELRHAENPQMTNG